MQRLDIILKQLGIETRAFEQGEIYIAEDSDVKIPDEKITGRTLHPNRPVVIVTNHDCNSDPFFPTILAAPLSHDVTKKRETDLEIFAATDGVSQDCLLRLGLTQPFLKIDLKGPRGKLPTERITQMLALYLHMLGVSMDDTDAAADLLFS